MDSVYPGEFYCFTAAIWELRVLSFSLPVDFFQVKKCVCFIQLILKTKTQPIIIKMCESFACISRNPLSRCDRNSSNRFTWKRSCSIGHVVKLCERLKKTIVSLEITLTRDLQTVRILSCFFFFLNTGLFFHDRYLYLFATNILSGYDSNPYGIFPIKKESYPLNLEKISGNYSFWLQLDHAPSPVTRDTSFLRLQDCLLYITRRALT